MRCGGCGRTPNTQDGDTSISLAFCLRADCCEAILASGLIGPGRSTRGHASRPTMSSRAMRKTRTLLAAAAATVGLVAFAARRKPSSRR
jgi:hypothetical protein